MSTDEQSIAGTNVVPASDLLRQWSEMAKERRQEIQSRNFGFGGPPRGIEEAISLLQSDVNVTMWFLDKTIKLLAAHEQKADTPPRAAMGEGKV